MKLMKNLRWAAIALGILGGSTNALACVVTPDSILTEGQTLQLVADCGAVKVQTINWQMAIGTGQPVSVTGDVTLAQSAVKKIYFTTPVGLTSTGAGEYSFSVTGTSVGGTVGDITTADVAKVVVKPASAAVALALGVNPVTPVDASCGTPPGTALQSMPTGTAQCSLGSKAALAINGPTSFTWSCLSLTGGAEANCYGVRGYTVTAIAPGAGGSISPPSQPVAAGGTASFSAAPVNGYSAAIIGCGGTQSGNNFTTGPVTANCTVTASFSTQPAVNGACGGSSGQTFSTAPDTGLCTTGGASSIVTGTSTYTWSCSGSNGGVAASCSANIQAVSQSPASSPSADPGTGMWIPPNTTGRVIANQSGSTAQYLTSYIPGCLNGENITSSSNSGCGGKSSYTDPTSGTSFVFGSGKTLGLRYTSKAGAGAKVKYFTLASGDGGNVGQTLKVWLSDSPTSTYETTATACKISSTQQPYVITGPGYCPIVANKQYYLFISTDAVGTNFRYLVNEGSADFN